MSNEALLQPVHGITLQDYSAASGKMAAGVSVADICNALGVELPIWDEASTVWVSRMQQDSTFTVITYFGQYFAEADQHPKLGGLTAGALSAEGEANLAQLKSDRYFYEELCGARQAAYEYGLDGAQWIQDNYGINLGDFQAVAMQWMNVRNNESSEDILHYADYMREKQKAYAAKFAAEQGGNVADDVEF